MNSTFIFILIIIVIKDKVVLNFIIAPDSIVFKGIRITKYILKILD